MGYDGDGFYKFQNDRLLPFFNASSIQAHPKVITSVMMDDLDSGAREHIPEIMALHPRRRGIGAFYAL